MKRVAFSVALWLLVAFAACVAKAQYDPTQAWSAIHYTKAAYCDASAISSWSCGSTCQFHPNFQLYNVYTNSSIESQAFSGYDPDANQVVLSIRGSSNIPNWINDLDFFKTAYPNSACGCEVHRGFLGEWMGIAGQALPDLASLVTQNPGASVFVVGHSLGAAVSILAAMDIITHITQSVSVYNFGEPRVGDSAWAQWVASRLPVGKQFRVTHERDPVPHVPPELLGFLHAPHELWYDNDGNTQWMDCNDSPTAESPDCSDSVIPYGVTDHLLYLGICTECSCDSAHLTKKFGAHRALEIMKRMNATSSK